MKGLLKLFIREEPKTEIITKGGTDAIETRGNAATLANRGKLPCMWWMGARQLIIVGADTNNPPIPYCENCPVPGGPIVKWDYPISSRAICQYSMNGKRYRSYSDDDVEWCWGPNINPNEIGEATWQFELPIRNGQKVKKIGLEISDRDGRLHSNKSGDWAHVLINGKYVSQYALNIPTQYHEYIERGGREQPLDPERGGGRLDITEHVDPGEKVRVTIRVGPYTRWDISKVALYVQRNDYKLTKLSWTLIGAVFGFSLSRLLP